MAARALPCPPGGRRHQRAASTSWRLKRSSLRDHLAVAARIDTARHFGATASPACAPLRLPVQTSSRPDALTVSQSDRPPPRRPACPLSGRLAAPPAGQPDTATAGRLAVVTGWAAERLAALPARPTAVPLTSRSHATAGGAPASVTVDPRRGGETLPFGTGGLTPIPGALPPADDGLRDVHALFMRPQHLVHMSVAR